MPAFEGGDAAYGGAGSDTLSLSGNYSALTFDAGSLSSIETISVAAGGSYDLTLATGVTLIVDGSNLATGDAFTVDGHSDLSGSLTVVGGIGTDTFTGSSGNDTFNFNAGFNAADQINGGAGSDTLVLNGGFGSLTFGATTMTNVETVRFGAGHNYSLTLADANVAAGATLTVDGSALGAADALTVVAPPTSTVRST